MKGRKRSRVHAIPKSSGMKILVKGAARRSHKTIARQAMSNKTVRSHVFNILKRDIQREIKMLSAKKTNSIFRVTTTKALSDFSWDELEKELILKAPTLFDALNACVDVNRRHRTTVSSGEKRGRKRKRIISNTTVIGVCAGILLRHCNHHMNLVQRLIALILHSGHSGKQVCFDYCHYIL